MDSDDYRFGRIEQKLDDLSGVVVAGFSRMQEKQDRTNGRVMKLELWRSYIVGALAVITGIVIPLSVYAIQSVLKLR